MNRAIMCCGILLAIGCTSLENNLPLTQIIYPHPVYPPLADREIIARALPSPYQLSDGVEVVTVGHFNRLRKVTIEEKLASLGAKVVAGKLVDRDGWEIFFWHSGSIGPAVDLGKIHEQFENLKRQGTVIEIKYWPGAENGIPPPVAY